MRKFFKNMEYVTTFFIMCVFVVNGQRYVGDICTLKLSGSEGTCKLLKECPQALDELQKFNRFPQTCGFQGTQPIVCCPNGQITTRGAGEISKKKCREYAKYVFETIRPPVLLIDIDEIESNECGHKVVPLIVGGEKANRKEFPHMALIGYDFETGNVRWSCGGTIISEQFILTAGHCLVSREFGPAKYVRVGMTNIQDTNQRQDLLIADRIPHPEYKSSSHYYDIALLKLQTSIKLNSYARPACLYTERQIGAKKAIATGWGYTSFGGSTSDDLLKVTLDLFTQEHCNRSYKNQIGRKLKNGIVEDLQLCAGSLDEEKDTCQGDSGGPLQIFHPHNDAQCMYDIIGLTSFGKACSGSPGVYSRISHFIKWIEDTVWSA